MLANPPRRPGPSWSVQIILTPPDRTPLCIHVVDPGSGTVTVQLNGELDASNAEFTAAVLGRRIEASSSAVQLDLSGLRCCDWAGIGLLVWAHNRTLLGGGTLILTGVGAPVAQLLSASQLDEALIVGDAGPAG